ncbi:hypothetical protein [Thermodesulfatator atlanticus]|uniref:hypothetical protein n=1 Tax=Thermodesulfatator atlanticus TaxID=501497 RepID=UPI0012F8AAFD|nr:hypothetical protein [Thermodesulfatator atlanticus]
MKNNRQKIKVLLAWDRDISFEELKSAVCRGESPFFERALSKLTWDELIKLFGKPETFFDTLEKGLAGQGLRRPIELDQRFRKKLNDWLSLKEIYERHCFHKKD